MKTTLYRLIVPVAVAVFVQTASADVLLTDNFHVTSNTQNVNQELAGRQAGPLAPALYTGWREHHQVGNTTTDVGQPGGAANSDYVLIAFDGSFFSDLNIASVATGPLTIQFDIYRNSSIGSEWGAFSLRPTGDSFPVAGAGEFGFLQRGNGGVQAFQNGGEIDPGWDTAGFAASSHWTLTFSDTAGTGSAFNGNGSQVTLVNGANTLGTLTLGQLNSAGLRLGFHASGGGLAGIANLSISGTPASLPPAGHNLSFEYDKALPGQSITMIPTSWTAFNQAAPGDFGMQDGGGVDFTVNNPLASPADGNNYCFINNTDPAVVAGIYQDLGPLQPNTRYNLTVAIGYRADFVGPGLGSPGIIALINGTDTNGAVLVSGGGMPATPNTWQDYAVTFTTGASVSGDVTVELAVAGAGTIQADFDNVRLTTTAAPVTPSPTAVTVLNPSFEAETDVWVAGPPSVPGIPSSWTAFNDNNFSTVQPASGSDFTVFNPLAAPADGNNFFAINEGPGDPTGGIYQDVGALKPNTRYTLTVATGRSANFGRGSGLGSPGIISLINGTDNTGAALASGAWIPATPNTWQNYTVTFTTGPSVSGDLTVELAVAPASTFQAAFDNVRLTATSALAAPTLAARISGGNLILTGTNGAPNGSYTLLTTTSLTAPITWTTNSTGNLDANGALSNNIPIITTQPAAFFSLRMP